MSIGISKNFILEIAHFLSLLSVFISLNTPRFVSFMDLLIVLLFFLVY